MNITVDKILDACKKKGYPVRENDSRDFNLNIVGIRKNTSVPNSFDDFITVFWKHNGKWTIRIFPATTDPGLYWLKNPSNPHGTGILKEQYVAKMWKKGKHQGKYDALVQVSPCIAIRDADKDGVLDFDSPTQETGLFGCNCHRANENGKSVSVEKWSAMCQVIQNRQILHPDFPDQAIKVFEFDYFMMLVDRRIQNWGDGFDYALISEKDFEA